MIEMCTNARLDMGQGLKVKVIFAVWGVNFKCGWGPVSEISGSKKEKKRGMTGR